MIVKKWWKTKKNTRFFLVFHCAAKKKLKPQTSKNQKKTLCLFGFSQFFNHHLIQKTKKTLSFFWFFTIFKPSIYPKKQKTLGFFSFFKVKTKKTKKNLGKTKKNQTWASDQTFSEKFWFFGFLVFSKFFLILSIE